MADEAAAAGADSGFTSDEIQQLQAAREADAARVSELESEMQELADAMEALAVEKANNEAAARTEVAQLNAIISGLDQMCRTITQAMTQTRGTPEYFNYIRATTTRQLQAAQAILDSLPPEG